MQKLRIIEIMTWDRRVVNYNLPYRTKIRRTKVSKFQLDVKNFVLRNILSVENFVQYFNTKVRQKSDKTVEISAWFRKFCPTKNFVRRKFCPMFQYKSQAKIGQKCKKYRKFCPTKILSEEIICIICCTNLN